MVWVGRDLTDHLVPPSPRYGQGHLPLDQFAQSPVLFSLEKRRLQGDLTAAFQYLKGPARELERDFGQEPGVIGQGVMALNSKRLDLD